MNERWLEEYVFLAFRLHRAVEAACASPFVEAYWGPPAGREQVVAEPEMAAADLVRHTLALADALPAQGFDPNRAAYLGKHIAAMETLARKLCGETFGLVEAAARCLDIRPTWTPEAHFEQAHALYATAPPGAGASRNACEPTERVVPAPRSTRTASQGSSIWPWLRHAVGPLALSTFRRLHAALTYGNGQQLVRRWLARQDRAAAFRRLLTEQWTPSQLAEPIVP